jgi:tetraacyldisaccharide 4'-kinase
VLLSILSTIYAAAARRRRERYAARPHLRRRLRVPVISVGNLAVGGRGKTPLACSLARMLLQMNERPAILSRGYRRTVRDDGVVVVRDPEGIRADLRRAGDEPLMLARQLPGVSILTCPDRYRAGRFAEEQFGTTVHILDDGFQHLQLDRDIDLVIVGREDIEHPFTLPAGRLREPLDTLIAADAVLAADEDVVVKVSGSDLPIYHLERSVEAPAGLDGASKNRPVIAVAGIANPLHFFSDLRRTGWNVVDTLAFRDHHPFTAADLGRITSIAQRAQAVVLTTEKDYVRLLPFRPWAAAIHYVPLTVQPAPLDRFRTWIADELQTVRGAPRG